MCGQTTPRVIRQVVDGNSHYRRWHGYYSPVINFIDVAVAREEHRSRDDKCLDGDIRQAHVAPLRCSHQRNDDPTRSDERCFQ